MKFIPVYIFDNYIEANIKMAMLKDAGIECWLKDEYTITMDPILTNAVGGIKLVVNENDADKAIKYIKEIEAQNQDIYICTQCRSANVQLVSTPRKAINWFTAIVSFFMGNYAITVEKAYHCFDCGNEFSEEEAKAMLN
jgi:Zn finger protein HypA/HybF involved in hydrogenase expression